MARNNESIGVSAEVAIAKSYGVEVDVDYANRSEQAIVDLLIRDDNVIKIFERECIPAPIKHTAGAQNPVDFILRGGKTLSVKTNQGKLGKVAPQVIGQPTAETYFLHLERYGISLHRALDKCGLKDTYENRSYIFKKISMNNTATVIDMYWKNLFDCDYYLHFFNLSNYANPINNYILLRKEKPPIWKIDEFSFTQSLDSWNESNTLKYYGVSMGEFQVHNNRNCFKFRFNMNGIMELFRRGYI